MITIDDKLDFRASRKGSRVIGDNRFFTVERTLYHAAYKSGRMYWCGCMKGVFHLDAKTQKRKVKWAIGPVNYKKFSHRKGGSYHSVRVRRKDWRA